MTESVACEYTVQGRGPALVLIHGIRASRQTWSNLLPVLTPHFTVITYDLRGHGTSPRSVSGEFQPFGLDELVADLAALLDALEIDQVHMAGHSLGGMIGPAYARAHPSRVLSLGLLSTAAFRTDDDSSKVQGVVKAMEERGIENVLPTLTDRWFTDSFIENHPEIVENRLKQVIATDADVFLNVFRIYAGTEMSPWLHEVNTPSLVLTGENDGGCNPRLNQQISDAMPDAKLVILPGYKHSLLLEAGETVAKEMLAFIKALGD